MSLLEKLPPEIMEHLSKFVDPMDYNNVKNCHKEFLNSCYCKNEVDKLFGTLINSEIYNNFKDDCYYEGLPKPFQSKTCSGCKGKNVKFIRCCWISERVTMNHICDFPTFEFICEECVFVLSEATKDHIARIMCNKCYTEIDGVGYISQYENDSTLHKDIDIPFLPLCVDCMKEHRSDDIPYRYNLSHLLCYEILATTDRKYEKLIGDGLNSNGPSKVFYLFGNEYKSSF